MIDVLYVSSAGGHFAELKIIIAEIAKREDLEYIVCTEKINGSKDDAIVDYYIKYGSRKQLIRYTYVTFINFVHAFKIIRDNKPRVIVSTGAHSCVIFFLIGKLYKTKNIYIESYAKVNSASLTYKIAQKLIDKVYVQHIEMLNIYPDAVFYGGVY